MGAPSDPKEQGVCGAAVERNNGANGVELETTGSGGLHAEVRAKGGISGTGGIAMLPASSFSGANAASTRTAAPGDDRAAKRARGGEAAGQAAVSAPDAPVSMSHVIYGGEAAPICASAFEAFGHQVCCGGLLLTCGR